MASSCLSEEHSSFCPEGGSRVTPAPEVADASWLPAASHETEPAHLLGEAGIVTPGPSSAQVGPDCQQASDL